MREVVGTAVQRAEAPGGVPGLHGHRIGLPPRHALEQAVHGLGMGLHARAIAPLAQLARLATGQQGHVAHARVAGAFQRLQHGREHGLVVARHAAHRAGFEQFAGVVELQAQSALPVFHGSQDELELGGLARDVPALERQARQLAQGRGGRAAGS